MRTVTIVAVTFLCLQSGAARVAALPDGQPGGDPLPSWNDGASKKAIVDFVAARDEGGRL